MQHECSPCLLLRFLCQTWIGHGVMEYSEINASSGVELASVMRVLFGGDSTFRLCSADAFWTSRLFLASRVCDLRRVCFALFDWTVERPGALFLFVFEDPRCEQGCMGLACHRDVKVVITSGRVWCSPFGRLVRVLPVVDGQYLVSSCIRVRACLSIGSSERVRNVFSWTHYY